MVSFTETGHNDISSKEFPMPASIWEDYYANLGTADSVQYRIVRADTSAVIYSGKAFRKPGETSILARINDVCAEAFIHDLPTVSHAAFTTDSPITFRVQTLSGSTWTTKATVEFIPDWSYDPDWDIATGLSDPIINRIDSRMPIFFSVYRATSISAQGIRKNGTTSTSTITQSAKTGTAVFLASNWQNLDRIVLTSGTITKTYQVVTSCAEYALYYVNAYGGWDCLLIEGGDMQSDSLKRYTREGVYDNNNIQNRGIHNYVNEITKGFTLYTGWLGDAQSQMMHNLVNSTDVYLYDIDFEAAKNNEIIGNKYGTATSEGIQATALVACVFVACALGIYFLYNDKEIAATIRKANEEAK